VSGTAGAFTHRACIYGSDRQFLDMALPFLEEGLSLGDPVLAVTTPANLELVNTALGARGADVDYAESAFFGRRPAQRVAAFHRYWKRHARGSEGTPVRILAEPVWAGRSSREIAAWTRMEAGLNVALAATTLSMICPYDTRIVPSAILAGAQHTHPAQVNGPHTRSCPDYADPADFARSCDADSLPDPPPGAAEFEFAGDLRGLRRFVASQAAAHGLTSDRTGMLVLAAGEVGTYLKNQAPGNATVRTWEQPGAVICDFRQARASDAQASDDSDPFLGLRPAELEPEPGDGLWLAGQICDWIEIRSGDDSGVIRLHVASRHNEEMAQPGIRYPI
jgi:MEDS: MEthanogen/methylotroph, DcmR Sensory domain